MIYGYARVSTDGQSVKSAEKGGLTTRRGATLASRSKAITPHPRRYTGLADARIVHAADIQDRDGSALVMAMLVARVSVSDEALRRWRIPGAYLRNRVEEGRGEHKRRNRQTLGRREIVRRVAQTLDRRTHLRLAGTMPQARARLGKLQSESARVLAPCLDPAHAAKAMQSSLMFPDRL